MLQKTLMLLSVLVFAGMLLTVVGCDTANKTVNPDPVVLNDDATTHDPPDDVEIVVTDTLIDYSDELPWLFNQSGTSYKLSNDPRIAVMGEAILAVTGWDGKVTKAIDGNAVSDWSWFTDPLDGYIAYNQMKSWYGKFFSSWIRPNDPEYIRKYWSYTYKPKSAYSQIDLYAFYDGLGRGAQCPSFVNAVLWRSSFYKRLLPGYDNTYADFTGSRSYTKPYQQARVGDILRTKKKNGHTAIIVKILAGTQGSSVTSVDLVDANFVGGGGNEIIGRHGISSIPSDKPGNGTLSDLDSYYVIDLIGLMNH